MKIVLTGLIFVFSMYCMEVKASTEPASFFYGVCLNTQANPERIASFAQAANWRNLPDNILETFVPERRPQRYFGWFVQDMRAIVIVLQGVDENRKNYRGCSVFFRDASPQQAIGELLSRHRVNNPIRESDGFQIYVHFRINVLGTRHQIMISYLEGEHQRGTLKINTLVMN